MDGGREKKKEDGGKEGSFLSHGQLGKSLLVGVCKGLKYVDEIRVLSFLLATGHPVPPLVVCRQQFISGPGKSCK